MIQDYPPSGAPTWRLITQEALGLLAIGVLYPFGLAQSRARTPRRREQRTVVLVHGYLSNRSALLPLAQYLRLRGLGPVLSFGYPSSAGIEPAAVALRDDLRRRVRGGRIDLVCHSLGGLVARLYLQELGGARRVDRCITLGTPHGGTYNAYWLWSRIGRELRPDSALLARLAASSPSAASVDFLSIVAGSDSLVIPRVFARHEREVHVPDVGHLALLFAPAVLRRVAEHLLEPPVETRA
ncbi:MAG TPA: alpha/beta fold hydrolase [Myxococcota bacterium]|nr:alpha/beta fold hydrolase [Myxococcota bacterium]